MDEFDEIISYFKELCTYLTNHKEARNDVLKNMSKENLDMFKNYCDNTRFKESRDYIHDLMSISKKDRENILSSISIETYKRLYEDSIVCLFNYLAEFPQEKRESFYPYLKSNEIEALEVYIKALKDDDYGGNGDGQFSLSAPKVLRPYKTLTERLGRALTESLMQEANYIMEGIRERQLARFEALIEEAERIKMELEEELGNDLEEGFSRRRGRHGH